MFFLTEDAQRNSDHLETEDFPCRKQQNSEAQKHSGSETLKQLLVEALITWFIERE